MKKATRALFFSAVVFPGAGFFILGHKRQGYWFLAVTLCVLLFLMADTVYKAQKITENLIASLMRNGILYLEDLLAVLPSLPHTIREQLKTLPGLFPANWVLSLTIVLGVIWVAGIVGVYIQGKKLT